MGSSHVRGRVGVPDRYTRRTALPTFTMLPLSVPWPSYAARPSAAVVPKLPPSEADWVVFTRPQPPDGLSLVSYNRLRSEAVSL